MRGSALMGCSLRRLRILCGIICHLVGLVTLLRLGFVSLLRRRRDLLLTFIGRRGGGRRLCSGRLLGLRRLLWWGGWLCWRTITSELEPRGQSFVGWLVG